MSQLRIPQNGAALLSGSWDLAATYGLGFRVNKSRVQGLGFSLGI